MTLNDVRELLSAELLSEDADLGGEIKSAIASDLMSDVLALGRPGELLLTGLANNQTIRTCEVAGISVVVFVRGKRPPVETVALARECSIPIMSTGLSMFEACGILYSKGITTVRGNA